MLGANKKKKVSEFATPYTVGNALTEHATLGIKSMLGCLAVVLSELNRGIFGSKIKRG